MSITNTEELRAAIVKEICDPTVKSAVSTLDIRVMGISSTGISDRMYTIMQLIEQHTSKAVLEARKDEMHRTLDGVLPGWGVPNPDSEGPMRVWADGVVHYTNKREAELKSLTHPTKQTLEEDTE